MAREIGDVNPIRDVENLLVYFHKEDEFFEISNQNFSKYFPKGSKCRTCPAFYVKYTGKMSECVAKMENFATFKFHIAESERIFGELIAFKSRNQLPEKSIYVKHRLYGYLWPFQTKDEFLMFDTRQNKYIKIERKNITKTFTRQGVCHFCPCVRKLQSSTTVIKHLQVLETRFYCYLILDDEKYNDQRNQERLNKYLESIKTKEINRPATAKRRFTNGHSINSMNSLIDDSQEIDATCSSIEKDEETMLSVLDDFKKSYENSFDHMNDLIDELKNKTNSISLDQAVVNNQHHLNLIKRQEDFQLNEKDFIFLKEITLKYADLDYLMNKYGISDEYEISKSEFTLNVQLKECSNDSSVQQVKLSNSLNASNAQSTSRRQMVKRNLSSSRTEEKFYYDENKEMNRTDQMDYEDQLDNSANNSKSLSNKIFEFSNFRIKTENCLDDADQNAHQMKRVKYN